MGLTGGDRGHGPGGGHGINIGSLSSLGPVPGLSAYAATKHGVLGWTTSIQGDLDLAGIPVRMHVVCPDASDTRMVQDVADNPEAAILFSGPRLLGAAEVAEQTVALLDGRKVVLVIPRWRGAVARAAAPFPRFGLEVMGLLRKAGARKRTRQRAGAGT